MKTVNLSKGLGVRLRSGKTLASLMAATVMSGSVVPAFATIDNTATVNGQFGGQELYDPDTSDGVDNSITGLAEPSDTESVDVENLDNTITFVKSAEVQVGGTGAFGAVPAGGVAVGDVIRYTFAVTNAGNQTLTDVLVTDVFDAGTALGGPLTVAVRTGTPITDNGTTGDSTNAAVDGDWDILAPDDVVFFEATYTVQQDDISTQVGGDGEINNTANVVAFTPADVSGGGGPTVDQDSNTVTIDVEDVDSALTIAKLGEWDDGGTITAVNGTSDNLPVGTVVTYTYTITNTGNVPVTDITLVDAHTSAGTFTQPDIDGATPSSGSSTDASGTDDVWSVLAPGDTLTVSTTYTIVQGDIDNYQ